MESSEKSDRFKSKSLSTEPTRSNTSSPKTPRRNEHFSKKLFKESITLKTKSLSIRSDASSPNTPRTFPKRRLTAEKRNEISRRSDQDNSSDEGR